MTACLDIGRKALGTAALGILVAFVIAGAVGFPGGAAAEQASQPGWPAAAALDSGRNHSCAILAGGSVRCFGYNGNGELGYVNRISIGDNEAPGSVGPVNLGQGRSAVAISAGGFHTCALLDDASVRCWGFGAEGRLGYRDTSNIGDDETPGSAGPVDLGGQGAKAISAGYAHTCAVLDDNSVRCWGHGGNGELGYMSTSDVGDDETPGSVGPVNLGQDRSAKAISAGFAHTCALLDDDSVRCWGYNLDGRLGYGNTGTVGDDETPGSVDPVNLDGHKAKAISAGTLHSCALLDDNTLRCWGEGSEGALGYGNTTTIGDNEPPGPAGPVNLGAGRSARAISAGRHSCAVLDDGSVRCWGPNRTGQLGYAHTGAIGDNEPAAAAGPVNLGVGRSATAISAGESHTCARLDEGSVRCWGAGADGRLGLCNGLPIGDDESPGSVAPVPLTSATCPGFGATAATPLSGTGPAASVDPEAAARRAEATRLRSLRACLGSVARHARRETRRARPLSGPRRTRARRHIRRHRSQLRRRCLKRWGRTPGKVTTLTAEALSATSVRLAFKAPGSDRNRPPAARSYLIKLSRRPIRSTRAFRRADWLCRGNCRIPGARVGATLALTVTKLRPRTTYYLAIAARDNVSRGLGPRSRAVKARTR